MTESDRPKTEEELAEEARILWELAQDPMISDEPPPPAMTPGQTAKLRRLFNLRG